MMALLISFLEVLEARALSRRPEHLERKMTRFGIDRVGWSALVLAGCLPVAGPRELPCGVREEELTASEASAQYEQVDVVCWIEHAEQREELDRMACRRGGNVLVRLRSECTLGSARAARRGIEYGVYTTRTR